MAMLLAAAPDPLRLAEMTADRCLYDQALTFLDGAPAAEQRTRSAQMLRARLLIQLKRGKEAVALLSQLPPGTGAEAADHSLLLGLADATANEFGAAERALQRSRQLGADADLVDEAMAMVRIQRDKLTEAEQILRRVLRGDPRLTGSPGRSG